MEVLSLIPTHLPSDKDLFHASFACRRWRKTFIQHAALWSQLDLTIERSGLSVKTLLDRAKATALDIKSSRLNRVDILGLLPPRAQQFRSLEFVHDCWPYIQIFSEAAPGPLPLLHTLKLDMVELETPFETMDFEVMRPILSPFFSGAVNLKHLVLHTKGEALLNHFIFPNLKTFELSVTRFWDPFPFSDLLDFFGASPTLETIRMRIMTDTFQGDIPPERVVVLPNVETFSVTQDEPYHRIAAHISCPSARPMSFVYEQGVGYEMPQEIFPTSDLWNAMGPQYMANTIDEVTLGIKTAGDHILFCSLSFLSSGLATLELGYEVVAIDEYQHQSPASLGQMHSRVFSQAFEAIRGHPLLGGVKRLRIQDSHAYLASHHLTSIAKEAGLLFESMGTLEELILDVDNLRPFIFPFFNPPGLLRVLLQPYTLPSIKELTIVEHSDRPFDRESVAAIVGFVKSQHVRGVPFEHAVFHMEFPPVGMAERLEQWVGAVYFSGTTLGGDQGPT